MKLPQISIHSQPAIIGAHTEPGKLSIQMGEAYISAQSKDAVVQIDSTAAVVLIDQSKLRAAMDGGSMFDLNRRIYSQMPELVRAGIKANNAKYERIANLHDGEQNPIARIALEQLFQERPKIEYMDTPSSDNVSFQPVLKDPVIQVTPADLDFHVTVTSPSFQYERGSVKFYMKQYPSVTAEVVNLDVSI